MLVNSNVSHSIENASLNFLGRHMELVRQGTSNNDLYNGYDEYKSLYDVKVIWSGSRAVDFAFLKAYRYKANWIEEKNF